jgi:Flp pilus assembly protein TadB
MILFLTFIIILLTVFSIYLITQIKSNNLKHQRKISELKTVISNLLVEQNVQSSNLIISDELKNKLKDARITIDENIMELQYDLVSIVSKNNLLK